MKKIPFEQPSIESETAESLSAKLLLVSSQLMEANKELKRMELERREMLANISHDLRAPITAIRSATDYLTSGSVLSEEDYRSCLSLIDKRTRFLEEIIQDMYYLFCVEDTSKSLNLQTVDAAFFFEEYFYDAIVDTRYDNHDMKLDISSDLSSQIAIDIPRIVRVLDNLFTNAVKYSFPESSITLKVTQLPSENYILVSVIDNGIGIPKEAIPHIFNRTYTVSSARTPNSNTGSGLGLSIVKTIVERHEGNVFCESEEGKGSCFSFTLPYIK